MPELRHGNDGEEGFDPMKSEVNQWLLRQPSVVNWLFGAMQWRGIIIYDPKTGKWHGQEPSGGWEAEGKKGPKIMPSESDFMQVVGPGIPNGELDKTMKRRYRMSEREIDHFCDGLANAGKLDIGNFKAGEGPCPWMKKNYDAWIPKI